MMESGEYAPVAELAAAKKTRLDAVMGPAPSER
jgi:hypothetical protein